MSIFGKITLDAMSDESSSASASSVERRLLLEDLAHYCTYANAAYGWKGLAFAGRFHLLGRNNRVLARLTGADRRDIVQANWHSKANRPVRSLFVLCSTLLTNPVPFFFLLDATCL